MYATMGIWRGRYEHSHNKAKGVGDLNILADWCFSLLDNFPSAREQLKANLSRSTLRYTRIREGYPNNYSVC